MLQLARKTPSHEDLFLARYSQLRHMATRLTRDPGQANDLLHDAFVHFVLARPALADIQNLDGYFYRMLRNLHLSRVRRASRAAEVELSMADYDSAVIGLASAGGRLRLQAEQELWLIAQHVCERRMTAASASVLVLRFFHGYYPSEIARLAARPRTAVNAWLAVARDEARKYLAAPVPSNPRQRHRLPEGWDIADASHDGEPGAIIGRLQQAIFAAPFGPCFSAREFDAHYGPAAAPPVPVPHGRLGHLVSCATCLDRASVRLGMPALASRSPLDSISREASRRTPHDRDDDDLTRGSGDGNGGSGDSGDDGGGAGGAGGAGGGGGATGGTPSSTLRRAARDIAEHRPRRLRLLVNGFELGELDVDASRNDVQVRVTLSEPLASCEVISEQGLRLAFLEIEPPPAGDVTQAMRVYLSDRRCLDLAVSFEQTWPIAQATYIDPDFAAQATAHTAAVASVAGDPADDSDSRIVRRSRHRLAWLRHALASLRSWLTIHTPRSQRAWTTAIAIVLLAAWMAIVSPSRVLAAVEQGMRALAHAVRMLLAPPHPVPPASSAAIPPATVPIAPSARVSRPRLDSASLARLEMDVLDRLDQAGALQGEQVTVAQTRHGVRVSGIVADEGRRRALRQALGALVSIPDLQIALDTAVDIDRQRRPAARTAPPSFQSAPLRNESPARDRLLASLPNDAVPVFITDALRASDDLRRHGWALERVALQRRPAELRALDADAFAMWQRLVVRHARALGEASRALRRQLEPIFAPAGIASDHAADARDTLISLTRAAETIDRVTTLATSADEDIRFALLPSPDGDADGRRLSEPAFWQQLAAIEQLAGALQRLPEVPARGSDQP
jgi:RNA polymerase sigma factor (sigma-70 family)